MIRFARGFTLIELMIAVAIVAILASIALPNYNQYLIKARRSAAESFMVDVADREKQYFLDARSYAIDPGALAAMGMAVPSEVAQYYTVTVEVGATAPSFVITATPIPGGRQVGDGALSLDSAGVKTPAGKW